MKKSISIIMIIILISTLFPINAQAVNAFYPDFSSIEKVRVMEIIDGNVYKVLHGDVFNEANMEIVKLVGVDTRNSKDAYTYASSYMLGKEVYMFTDIYDSKLLQVNNWRNVYIVSNTSETLNELLLKYGYASIDTDYKYASSYSYFLDIEKSAKISGIGVWKNGYDGNYYENGPKININTANITQLTSILQDMEYTTALKIIEYRKKNPFNTIDEIKNVDALLDSKWYAKNKQYLTVITNLWYAETTEINTVFNTEYSIYPNLADNIVKYRTFNELDSFTKLLQISGMTSNILNSVKEFITFDNVADYKNPASIKKININTASVQDLITYCQLNEIYAVCIYNATSVSDFVYRNLEELNGKPTYINDITARTMLDNVNFFTDINSAEKEEIISLLGHSGLKQATKESYAESIINRRPFRNVAQMKALYGNTLIQNFEDVIYFGSMTKAIPQNINISSRADIAKTLKLNNQDKILFMNHADKFTKISDIPFSISDYDMSKICLFTNLNTATAEEILALDPLMNSSIVNDILEFRYNEVIAGDSDLYSILSKYSYGLTIYLRILDAICYK